LLTSRQIFRYTVPARTVTKKALVKVTARPNSFFSAEAYISSAWRRGWRVFVTSYVGIGLLDGDIWRRILTLHQ